MLKRQKNYIIQLLLLGVSMASTSAYCYFISNPQGLPPQNSFILYQSARHDNGTTKHGNDNDTNWTYNGPACPTGYQACATIHIMSTDDIGGAVWQELEVQANISKTGNSASPYNVWVQAFIHTDTDSYDRGISYDYTIDCVLNSHVESGANCV